MIPSQQAVLRAAHSKKGTTHVVPFLLFFLSGGKLPDDFRKRSGPSGVRRAALHPPAVRKNALQGAVRSAVRLVSSRPLVMAVSGATVTRPKDPTTVWTISAATYL